MVNKIGSSFKLANIPNGSLITVTISGLLIFLSLLVHFYFSIFYELM